MLQVKARAKVNWTLDLVGTRQDGYHLVDMLMGSVELHDTLYLEKAEDISLAVQVECEQDGTFHIPLNEKNLVIRAAQSLRQVLGETRGAAIRLVKRIPVGAGLGGGSADAAAAMEGLCQLWEKIVPMETKLALGLSIGADVPFMLTGGLAIVQGVGEILSPLPVPDPTWLVIVQPCEGLSAKEVYEAYDAGSAQEPIRRPDKLEAQAALTAGDLPRLARAMGNVLEPASIAKRPLIGNAIARLQSLGAAGAMMTGSGSAVYGIFCDETKARAAGEELRRRWRRTFVTHTAREGCSWRRI